VVGSVVFVVLVSVAIACGCQPKTTKHHRLRDVDEHEITGRR
jgi:hypothetical protein